MTSDINLDRISTASLGILSILIDLIKKTIHLNPSFLEITPEIEYLGKKILVDYINLNEIKEQKDFERIIDNLIRQVVHSRINEIAEDFLIVRRRKVYTNTATVHEQGTKDRNSKCTICGNFLFGRILVNPWGEPFCERHLHEFKTCFSCGRLITRRSTKGGVIYKDGRNVCNKCRESAIATVTQAEGVMMNIRIVLKNLGLDLNIRNIPLYLVNTEEIMKFVDPGQGCLPAGAIIVKTKMEGDREASRQIAGIAVLHGLPMLYFGEVLAHELGHAYLRMNFFPNLAPPVEEGLADLYAIIWLESQKHPDADKRRQIMMKNPDSIYGDGLRAAYTAMKGRNLHELLNFVRINARFPD